MEWVKIDKKRYFRLLKENKENLTCYSSCTDIDYVLTKWGFKDCDLPFIKAVDQLRYDEGPDEEWQYRYYEYK